MSKELTTQPAGKLSSRDARIARVLKTAPLLAFPILSLPAPIVFLVLFLTATSTESAALLLLLTGLSFTFGVGLALIVAGILLLYRRSWLAKLRDRLASDGITASEVVWFRAELTTAEKKSLAEIQSSNPLLADAYLETLASRLTASRVISRSKREILKVERRLNRARTLPASTSASLQEDLIDDREQLVQVRDHANDALLKAKTRLQMIEATASRKLNQQETDSMMRRLGNTQDQLPLVLEMARLEQQALREVNVTTPTETP